MRDCRRTDAAAHSAAGAWLLMLALAFSLLGGPQVVAAQQTAAPPQTQPQGDEQQPPPPSRPDDVMPDPAAGPLQPVPSRELPDAPSTTVEESSESTAAQQDAAAAPPAQTRPQEPAGTAAAERGRVSGGAASRPAGSAIAPAKQRQVRSFLIKLGAVAGAALAIGTVYALSRGTPSAPPGTNAPPPQQ